MTYQEYLKSCRAAHAHAVKGTVPADLDGTKLSELHILAGEQDAALAAIRNIPDPRAAYLQSAKAARHFECDSLVQSMEVPPFESSDWLLPILRAASSTALSREDGSKLEKYVFSTSSIKGTAAAQSLAVVANSYRNGGDLAGSSRMLEQAFRFASTAPRAKPKPIKGIDRSFAKRRQTAFHDLLRFVDFQQYKLFPCSGTLLGLYRDGDFIPSDGDVDIGCLDSGCFQAVKSVLRASGRFYLSPGRKESNFNARHINGAKIDISQYVDRGEGWAKTSHVYEWRFSKFAVAELATDYGRLPVPESPEDYLAAMYEDWWVPMSGYDSRIDSPNLVYVSPEEVVLVFAGHLLASFLSRGDEARLAWEHKFERLPAEMRAAMDRYSSQLSA